MPLVGQQGNVAHEAQSPAASERTRSFFGRNTASNEDAPAEDSDDDKGRPTRWSMGVLNDSKTHEVPGSVLLLTGERNEPLGLRNAPARTSHSSLPAQLPTVTRRLSRQAKAAEGKKKTKDGAIILEPQPEDSHNDPLNWPAWKRDAALLSLGLYCMVGGGMTPILAAGFTNVASTYDVTVPKVALTTGLYMMGLGVGSVVASPTAILYGKRPVYLVSVVIFICTAIWCALSPSYASLVVARVFMGIAVSPVECLPSATIAEIFFLHERAYRIGIYTLLLLGGKNLIPLVSAAVIQSLGWRWVFWVVAFVVGFCGILLFLFVPETFWDRTPIPKSRRPSKKPSRPSLFGLRKWSSYAPHNAAVADKVDGSIEEKPRNETLPVRPALAHHSASAVSRSLHVGFVPSDDETVPNESSNDHSNGSMEHPSTPLSSTAISPLDTNSKANELPLNKPASSFQGARDPLTARPDGPPMPDLHTLNSAYYNELEKNDSSHISPGNEIPHHINNDGATSFALERPLKALRYTAGLRDGPRRTFVQQLKPYNGRLHHDNWFRVAVRPFILFAYPAVLWSSIVYACSVGWLIVLSESVAVIYRTRDTYNFSALSTGLIYISPFVGGILGTAVAGKVSDIVVRAMSKRNGGLYEPEFRLVMAAPVAVTTVIGLMGYGWSAKVHDAWIVPTIFFGVISFGCSLGSTTAITFCVDSYRQYAGEALVTLNFSKNIFHGLVFSLFFNTWLEADGSKTVFIWLGVIQLILMTLTVPMYIFGKRARMWTVRKNLMEKF